MAAGKPFEESLGNASRAAAGVEYTLVAGEHEPIKDGFTPPRHRVGDSIVGSGIPVAHGHGLTVAPRGVRAPGPQVQGHAPLVRGGRRPARRQPPAGWVLAAPTAAAVDRLRMPTA